MKMKNISLWLLVSFFVTSCTLFTVPSVPVNTDEAMVQAVYTAAAQTLTALAPTVTNTPRPTFTEPVLDVSTALPSMTPEPLMEITETIPPTLTRASTGYCENIQFWADVEIEQGQSILPGTGFTKTWSFKNIGTCEIGSGYVLTRYNGSVFGDLKGKLKSITSPGAIGLVSVNMTAPTKPGTYSAFYMFVNPNGSFFGPTFTVRITVPKPTATYTPLPTVNNPDWTPTASNTPKPTKTPTLTKTPKPTKTPTP